MNDDRFYLDTYNLPLTRQEREIASFIRAKGSATTRQLADLLYGSGGYHFPYAAATVRVQVYNLRNKLKEAGWTIPPWPKGAVKGSRGQTPAVYTIERIGDGEQ